MRIGPATAKTGNGATTAAGAPRGGKFGNALMWVRKRLDIGWRDLALGLLGTALPMPRVHVQARLEEAFGGSDNVLACLSVRSGLDLLLSTLGLPERSEVLMSAMTIPDMARIVEHHGLTPVPVDLNPFTLGPSAGSLRRALSPSSRAIVVAHLCGGRIPMEPILAAARQCGLVVIEDCAQAFDGRGYTGDPSADVSMFSFGPIKTATALGGALIRVRDRGLLEQLRARHAQYPVQRRRQYAARLLKYAAFKALSGPTAYGLLLRLWRAMGWDYDRLVNGSVRGFPGPGFFSRIRQQPCAALMALLERRLRTYDPGRLERRAAQGELLARLLEPRIACPSRGAAPHNSWVFPILVENPAEVIAALRENRFDATQGHSMCVVAPPPDHRERQAVRAARILSKIVYLPLYPELPDSSLARMAQVVLATARRPVDLDDRPVDQETEAGLLPIG